MLQFSKFHLINILYCFYFIDSSKEVRIFGFNLSKNYEDIICNDIFYKDGNKEVYVIKSFHQSNSNSILLCYYGWYFIKFESDDVPKDHTETYCIS